MSYRNAWRPSFCRFEWTHSSPPWSLFRFRQSCGSVFLNSRGGSHPGTHKRVNKSGLVCVSKPHHAAENIPSLQAYSGFRDVSRRCKLSFQAAKKGPPRHHSHFSTPPNMGFGRRTSHPRRTRRSDSFSTRLENQFRPIPNGQEKASWGACWRSPKCQ